MDDTNAGPEFKRKFLSWLSDRLTDTCGNSPTCRAEDPSSNLGPGKLTTYYLQVVSMKTIFTLTSCQYVICLELDNIRRIYFKIYFLVDLSSS